MADRADAHIHLFEKGFRDSFTNRPGVQIDEVACYQSLATEHDVKAALVVGYAGDAWCTTNNDFLARTAPKHEWVRPIAYMAPANPPGIQQLTKLKEQGFVGLSCYVFGQVNIDALLAVPDDLWSWLTEQRWLLSVNSEGSDWSCWLPVLQKNPELRLIISHLGLPPKPDAELSPTEAHRGLAHVLALAEFPGPRVKLSGFYALSDPGHDYPHRGAWPYVTALCAGFEANRLLWGSDFSPCLDMLTFPQTFGHFAKMPFLSADDRRRIEGANLLALLNEVTT